MIPMSELVEMFEAIAEQTDWDMNGEMLWESIPMMGWTLVQSTAMMMKTLMMTMTMTSNRCS